MENNPVKKLNKAAAILSLTAVLASMPVSAAQYSVNASASVGAYEGVNHGALVSSYSVVWQDGEYVDSAIYVD